MINGKQKAVKTAIKERIQLVIFTTEALNLPISSTPISTSDTEKKALFVNISWHTAETTKKEKATKKPR